MRIMALLAVPLCLAVGSIAAQQQSATPMQSAPGKAKIVIRSEPLRGNSADVEINGKRVASIGADDVYTGMHDAGKIVLTTKGGRVEIDAQSDREYVFEIAMLPSTTGFLLFGLAGSSAMADYSISLKETRDVRR